MPHDGRPCIIAASQRIEDQYIDAVKAVDPRVRIVRVSNNDEWAQEVPNAEILLGLRPRRDEISRAAQLRWVHTMGAGVDRLVRDFADSEIVVTNSHVHAEAISEHVFALLLAHARQMREIFDYQAKREWGKRQIGGDIISGRTMGILGLGNIGQAVAARAHAFGMKVWGVRRRARPTPEVDRVVGKDALDEVLKVADVLVVALPLTPETNHLLDGEKLALLPKGAFVINIGRGALIDEPALIRALTEGRLSGAGLDVFSEEPLPRVSPLWTTPNVIVSPHVSGNFPHYMERVIAIFIANLHKYLTGQPLSSVVDTTLGY